MSQPGRCQLEHLLWVQFVRECCPNSDSDSTVPEIFWDKNRQSASEANPVKVSDDTILPGCLICFLLVNEETYCLLPWGKCVPEIFQDSPGGQWCYDVSWSHTGFCLISQIFQDSRWSEYWSCVLGPCISSWSVQWVYNWGSVWFLFGLGIGITVASLHWLGRSAEVHILFRIYFRIFSVSSLIVYKWYCDFHIACQVSFCNFFTLQLSNIFTLR